MDDSEILRLLKVVADHERHPMQREEAATHIRLAFIKLQDKIKELEAGKRKV